jgi:hypothetical protein
MASAPAARADIVYADITDTDVLVSENIVVIDLDRNGPGPHVLTVPWNSGFAASYDLVVSQASSALIGILDHVEFTMLNGQTWANANAGIVHRLPAGSIVGPESSTWFGGNSWLEYQDNGAGAWDGFDGEAFIGFRFDPTHAASTFNYGWFRVYYDDAADRVTLLDYAFESTPGVSIVAGSGVVAIPESGSLLIVGGAGLATVVVQFGRRAFLTGRERPR